VKQQAHTFRTEALTLGIEDEHSKQWFSEEELNILYGTIRSQLDNFPVQKIRHMVAAATFNVSRIPSKSESKSGIGSRAEVMPAIDKLFGEMSDQSKLKALQLLAEEICGYNSDEEEKLQKKLSRHGYQFINGAFIQATLHNEPITNSSNIIKGSSNFFVNEMMSNGPTLSKDASKVFVVHGRNEAARMAIFDFLRALDLKPVEWNEAIAFTGKATPSIDEILDAAFDQAQAILVLFTGDDLVRLGSVYSENEKTKESLSPQPRPNVLFEAGLALGRKPDRTILVQLGDIRQISDIAGKHIVRLDNSTEKRLDLMGRLSIAGCYFNASLKKDWLKTGDFESCVVWPDKEEKQKIQPNSLKPSYLFEDLKRQRELLLEFLGQPKADFYTLHGVGLTWDENWRRDKIRLIKDWVEKNTPIFPQNVQKTLIRIGNMTGTMFTEHGLKLTLLPEAVEIIYKDFELVENYLKEIEKELKG